MKKITNLGPNLVQLIEEAKVNYKFQPTLTKKLDALNGDFTEINLLEIILWKTNRYPEFTNETIQQINSLRNDFEIEKAKILLRNLLNQKGFDLPMASTVLRFACPEKFQIIDQRVYRFIYDNEDEFKIPHNIDKKIEIYFNYIEKLNDVCNTFKIPFDMADRILYQLDKDLNSDFPIKY